MSDSPSTWADKEVATVLTRPLASLMLTFKLTFQSFPTYSGNLACGHGGSYVMITGMPVMFTVWFTIPRSESRIHQSVVNMNRASVSVSRMWNASYVDPSTVRVFSRPM